MKISFVRGAYLNNFEGQNYPVNITGYSSRFPIDGNVRFPVIKLPSIADWQRFPLLNWPIKFLANRMLGDSQILFGLEKYIIGSDIVHVADPHYYYSFQSALLKYHGAINKLVTTSWETIPFNNESVLEKKRIKYFTMSQTDHFICYSEKARQCLITEGVSAKKISLIPLGVNTGVFHPAARQSKKITILFVGRLVEEKGITDVCNAFALANKSISEVKLRIVGSGPLENWVRSFIMKHNLQNKITIEKKSYKEMPEVYRKADILCVPSKKTKTWEEQYGMVFIEAMSSGLPIVSYKTGVIPEVVGTCGLLAAEGDKVTLTAFLVGLCTDSQLRVKLGTMGRERAKKLYNAHTATLKIEQLYKNIGNMHE